MVRLTRLRLNQIVRSARNNGERPILHRANLRTVFLCGLDLSEADLTQADLRDADLTGVDLTRARLCSANLSYASVNAADLSGADLTKAKLYAADFSGACLDNANFYKANIRSSDFSWGHFYNANFTEANLCDTTFREADLSEANFSGATIGRTTFGNVDLREVKGLETVHHQGHSYIDSDNLFRLRGYVPKEFLRGCGINETDQRFSEQSLIEKGDITLPEQLNTMTWEADRKSLRRRINQHRTNLNKLQEQATLYGEGETPLRLLNQIDHEEQMIEKLQKEYVELENTSSRSEWPRLNSMIRQISVFIKGK